MNYFWPGSVNTHWGPGPINTNWGPRPVNTNLVLGPVNTYWGPGPVKTNLGPGPGAGKYKYPQNEVNNWQQVGFFTLTYKTKHNTLASLHNLTKQNTLKTGCSFCDIAKKSVQVDYLSPGLFPQCFGQ